MVEVDVQIDISIAYLASFDVRGKSLFKVKHHC